jgi:hypothetical protein
MTRPPSRIRNWTDYFRSVKQRIHIDRSFFSSAFAVIKVSFRLKAAKRRMQTSMDQSEQKTIAFYPQPGGPWYTIWMALQLTPLKIVRDYRSSDYVFVFDDRTMTEVGQNLADKKGAILINHRISDISKENVGRVFDEIFGYSIAIDPTKYTGKSVRKSDVNGVHDGIEIDCPIDQCEVLDGYAYQKYVDTVYSGEYSEDLRVAYAFGKIALVFHKHKPLDDKFGTNYLQTQPKPATDVFSDAEIGKIVEFCDLIGLDFGAVDIMRDKHDGKIYIVDVNKTCMPVLSISTDVLFTSIKTIADVFNENLPHHN